MKTTVKSTTFSDSDHNKVLQHVTEFVTDVSNSLEMEFISLSVVPIVEMNRITGRPVLLFKYTVLYSEFDTE